MYPGFLEKLFSRGGKALCSRALEIGCLILRPPSFNLKLRATREDKKCAPLIALICGSGRDDGRTDRKSRHFLHLAIAAIAYRSCRVAQLTQQAWGIELLGLVTDSSVSDNKRTDSPFSTEHTIRSLTITNACVRTILTEYAKLCNHCQQSKHNLTARFPSL